MADGERKHMSDITGVRYLGTHDRTLSVDDLASIGVTAIADLRWDDGNDHFVAVNEFNAATADFFAEHGDEFELV